MVTLTHRSRRRLLCSFAFLFASGTVGVVLYGFIAPLAVHISEQEAKPAMEPNHPPLVALPLLNAFASAYQRDLRRPLFDPEIVPTPPQKRPPLSLTLLGTAVEDGHAQGVFRDKSGRTRLATVGESLEGAEILSIDDGSALVKFLGETIRLSVPSKGEQP